jgi:nicotinate phosphoribosyltransferase
MYNSHLDNDLYKFHMGAFFWHYYRGISTEYAYKCRDPQINLLCIYDELKDSLVNMSYVGLQKDEQKWLFENTKVTQDYLINFLRDFHFYPSQVILKKIDVNPGIDIRIKGPLEEASLWEMPLMSTISELYFRKMYGKKYEEVLDLAKKDLSTKINNLLEDIAHINDEDSLLKFLFSEFGTRRRFSFDFQDFAVDLLQTNIPQCLVGTSNMFLAKKHGIKAVGTQAHEAFMLYQALVHPEDSQRRFLRDWIEFYRGWLGICLTDTLGPKKWDRDFTKDLMIEYTGQRHDSGDPCMWGEERLNAYAREGIDSKEKTLLFSDNLNFDKALTLTRMFGDRVNVSHGIGTFITNNISSIPNHKALNQVIKIVRANGRPVAKLSDDPMKAQCEDPIFLEYIKHISE